MNGPMDAISVKDFDPAVAAIFSKPEKFIGKKLGYLGIVKLSKNNYRDIITKLTGVSMTYVKMPNDDYAKLFPGSDDLAAMFHYYEFGNPVRDIPLTKKLNPNAKSFTDWVTENKALF